MLFRRAAKTKLQGIRPEAELLLHCSKVHIDPTTAKRIRTLLQKRIDFSYLTRTAGRHGLTPLLYQSVNSVCMDALPSTVTKQLRKGCYANALHSVLFTRELLELLELFERHEVEVLPLKGPVLAAMAYGSIYLRQFNDLDLLFHREDIGRAKQLLVSRGYRPKWKLTQVQEAAHTAAFHALSFVQEETGVVVDLHWDLAPSYFGFASDAHTLWHGTQSMPVEGREVRCPAPEDLLIFLCVHGFKHSWCRLGWICDVAELLRVHQHMDWDRVIDQANRLASRRILFLGLFLANELLGARLPAKVQQSVQSDSSVKRIAWRAQQWLFRDGNGLPSSLQKFVFRFQARDDLGQIVRYYVHVAFTPTAADWNVLTLPWYLFPLYCAFRPVRRCVLRPMRFFFLWAIWPYLKDRSRR